MLNRLPPKLLPEEDAEAIDLVDALMDDLYRRRQLFYRGHRWLAESPASIRGDVVSLFEDGNISREPATRQWSWDKLAYHFVISAR